MSKRKIMVVAGAVVLTAVGFLNSSASKKFVQATSAFFRTAPSSAIVTLFRGAAGSVLTTVKRTGFITAFYQTAGGGAVTLFGAKSGTTLSKTLFRNPNL